MPRMPTMQAVVKVLESEGVEVAFDWAVKTSERHQRPALVEVLIEREADAAMGPALDKIREFDNA